MKDIYIQIDRRRQRKRDNVKKGERERERTWGD